MLAYLRGQGKFENSVGHNPLGAGSVLLMLLLLGKQVESGLMSDEEIATAGPLAQHVSSAMVGLATHYHKATGKPTLIALLLQHVAAIAFYRTKKKQNLTGAMVHGDREFPHPVPASPDDGKSRALAVLLFVMCSGVVYLGVKFAD